MAQSSPTNVDAPVPVFDRAQLAERFAAQAEELRRWVRLRLDPRLRGRVSASDVLQEVFLAAEQRLEHYRSLPDMPFGVWIRLIAGQRMTDLYRRHIGAQGRDAGREVSLAADSHSGAGFVSQLQDDLTSPSQAAIRHEALAMLLDAVEGMDPLDREILDLRHFQEKTNDEAAAILGIPKGTASKRYVRALGRLRGILEKVPGLLELGRS